MRRALFVRINRVANHVVRRLGLKRFRGGDLLFLTTTGRKSGKQRTTPALYLVDQERWIVVASNGGADWEPGWWLNEMFDFEAYQAKVSRQLAVVALSPAG